MIRSLLIASLAALASTAVIAGDTYSALDADNSGGISEAEAAVMPGLTEQWTTLDTDANGEQHDQGAAMIAPQVAPGQSRHHWECAPHQTALMAATGSRRYRRREG